MSTPASSIPLSGLARRLVQDGQLNEADANRALEQSRKKRVPLVAYLVDEKLVEARSLAQSACEEFGTPVFDLDTLDRDHLPKNLMDEKLVRQHQALPLYRRGNRLFVGLADPMNLTALDEIKFNTGIATEPVLVEQDKLVKLIEDALNDSGAMMEGLMDEDLDDLQIKGDDEDRGQDVSESDIDDTPVVRFVNKVLLDAINKKASDIHFEPYEKNFRVRFRLDGVLSEVAHPPSNLAPRITARIKVMSRMDISERRIPQDGRIKMQLSKNRAIDFRVNTCPTLYGEKVVLRILDPTSAFLGIDQLGYEPHQKDLYMNALSKPYGMILVTGPTGSGKTVSLYTGLGILNTADRNISTAEDPAEINMPGVNQVNVNPKVGLTFASALRAFLRQDPDIIMVGEIRDLETAEIAIKAAQTGHLVLSTLHTNDAPQTLTRLANMGVPSYNIASSILLIIAQRLGRRLCNHCKTPHDVPDEVLLEEGFTEQEVKEGIKLFKPVGCDRCTLGYKGRVGIYQVLPISEGMQRLILEGGNSMQLAEQAEQEGIADLRRSGLLKVKAGITSLEEINRITKD
ncbi:MULTISPECIES: type IV-A pilus assembly ATPase PilB [Ectothiorhodospira]|uniref:type IV-A pilus assembly ATPase PilB n=1 Tax=Ectothiorhodospira TaxID=1051 RepID=UPI001EE8BE36|nr:MULTISPECIES: type IV-A pilus assembly ATPase PilB [Ectothiorhodospira]MCG5493381.1 type IV-A pilus assembly ATPase PilB [Ectothiorhodospira variabilis]MCG5496727.1 type IV-A pilus assembly ATPase PilB [Ectothiorhodospira variabilis]MCG5502710.1 type IV-A pilus assembly ATPase PilB [Ectothiorhodospira variabilis]MCG5505524.1 type IV-A pilus assembly ATPase PilB [Ectothiorhodospira variabilis]MCG5523436.1 type IV-A pilus assembly ATPase PilB [Ectothiorhodospira haloalkaliphila]